jgi:TATA-box binding protein (TBP) (component of TFIID and TFIIIB)
MKRKEIAEVLAALEAEGLEIEQLKPPTAPATAATTELAATAQNPNKRRRRRRAGEPLEPKATPPARGVIVFNVVFLARLRMRLNAIAATVALHGRYDPKLFTAWLVRPRGSRSTLSVFNNGKVRLSVSLSLCLSVCLTVCVCVQVIVAGAKHETEAWLAVQQLAYRLQMHFHTSVDVNDFHVKNMVGTAWLGYRVDLMRLSEENHFCDYDPCNFPGLQYRYYRDRVIHRQKHVGQGRKLALVVFEPGTVVITGAISFEQLTEVFDQCEPFLRRYALPEPPRPS